MTTNTRIFVLSAIIALVLSACNWGNTTPTVNGIPVVQATLVDWVESVGITRVVDQDVYRRKCRREGAYRVKHCLLVSYIKLKRMYLGFPGE